MAFIRVKGVHYYFCNWSKLNVKYFSYVLIVNLI